MDLMGRLWPLPEGYLLWQIDPALDRSSKQFLELRSWINTLSFGFSYGSRSQGANGCHECIAARHPVPTCWKQCTGVLDLDIKGFS